MPSAGDLVNALMGYFTPDPNLSAPYRPGFNGPSWMDQAQALQGADIRDPQQRQALINFASGMVGPQALTTRIANPIRAFHGSPYDFDAFDVSKIGTGEGAQAYGHGFYFAEHPETAETYRKFPQGMDAQSLDYLNRIREEEGLPRLSAASKGHGYEVAIHADPQQFLDYDKPLSEQSEQVREILREFGLYPRQTSTGAHYDPPGSIAYDALKVPRTTSGNDVAASNTLRQAGIQGIQYLDQGSRFQPQQIEHLQNQISGLEEMLGREPGRADISRALDQRRQELSAIQPTRNYVVFDPSIVEIMRKYGFIPPLAGAAAYGASQGQQQ